MVLTEAKKALVEANGNFDNALKEMRQKGLTRAGKKASREANEGVIDSYVHDSRIGVIVELNCETDFVARMDDFKKLAHEIAMQVAGMNPLYVSEYDIPATELDRVKSEFTDEMKDSDKPKEIIDKIIDGKVKKHFSEQVLLDQSYFRDDKKTISDLIKENIARYGENIVIRRFSRFEIGLGYKK